MIRCCGCGIEKSESEFYWKDKAKTRRQEYCKECKSRYNKVWYQKNKEKHKANARSNAIEYSRRNYDIIVKAKDSPCTDCGVKYPPYVMDFDHLEGFEKLANVGNMRAWATDKLVAEIAKCEVVCSNCHRERTYSRLCNSTDRVLRS